MQSVSNDWKALWGTTMLPPSKVKVSVYALNESAQNDAILTESEGFTYGSIIGRDGSDPYVSLEQGAWDLSRKLPFYNTTLASPYHYNEYKSASLSKADAKFNIPIILTITAPSNNFLPGITIVWSKTFDEWAMSFLVEVKSGGTTVDTYSETGNLSVTSHIPLSVSTWDTIKITITEWSLPYSYCRVEGIYLGAYFEFTNKDIISFEADHSGNMCSLALPLNKCTFEIDNSDDKWNILNPLGLAAFLEKGEKVITQYAYEVNGRDEWIDGGTYYLSEWDAPTNGHTATFTAIDILQYLTDIFTPPLTTLTPKTLAEAALTQESITNYDLTDFYTANNCYPNTADGYKSYTCAEIIQMCANASNCVLYVDRQGKIWGKTLDTTVQDYEINRYNSFEESNIELTEPLKKVSILDAQGDENAYYNNSSDGVEEVIGNPIIYGLILNPPTTQPAAVAASIAGVLNHRVLASGTYRADPRLDLFDVVELKTKYGDINICITEIKYTYNGAFKGEYKGREV